MLFVFFLFFISSSVAAVVLLCIYVNSGVEKLRVMSTYFFLLISIAGEQSHSRQTVKNRTNPPNLVICLLLGVDRHHC